MLHKVDAFIRCPQCGCLEPKLMDEIRHSSKAPVGNYVCINCTKKFEFSEKKDATPSCPKCGSLEVVKKKDGSPKVRFVNRPEKDPLSKRQIKKLRWIKRAYQNLKVFEEQREGTLALMQRLRCTPKRLKLMKQQFEITIKELDKQHQKLLKSYMEEELE